VAEAIRLGIPVFGMVDTNSNPNGIDYVIPANDDATKSIDAVLTALCDAINEGLEERKVEKVDADAAEASGKGAARRRTRKSDDEETEVVAEEAATEAPAEEA
jgi:small subunit ribosomal protein S2